MSCKNLKVTLYGRPLAIKNKKIKNLQYEFLSEHQRWKPITEGVRKSSQQMDFQLL